MPWMGNKNVGLQRPRRVNSMSEYSEPGAVVRETVACWSKPPDPAKQRRPLAPREELSVGQADAWTPFGGGVGREGLGLLLRSKRATLLAHGSRALSGGASGGEGVCCSPSFPTRVRHGLESPCYVRGGRLHFIHQGRPAGSVDDTAGAIRAVACLRLVSPRSRGGRAQGVCGVCFIRAWHTRSRIR